MVSPKSHSYLRSKASLELMYPDFNLEIFQGKSSSFVTFHHQRPTGYQGREALVSGKCVRPQVSPGTDPIPNPSKVPTHPELQST